MNSVQKACGYIQQEEGIPIRAGNRVASYKKQIRSRLLQEGQNKRSKKKKNQNPNKKLDTQWRAVD